MNTLWKTTTGDALVVGVCTHAASDGSSDLLETEAKLRRHECFLTCGKPPFLAQFFAENHNDEKQLEDCTSVKAKLATKSLNLNIQMNECQLKSRESSDRAALGGIAVQHCTDQIIEDVSINMGFFHVRIPWRNTCDKRW